MVARFGGTYGLADGTAFTTTVTDVERGLYIGYREFLTANASARPFTWDLMTYTSEASAYAYAYGDGDSDDFAYAYAYTHGHGHALADA